MERLVSEEARKEAMHAAEIEISRAQLEELREQLRVKEAATSRAAILAARQASRIV